MDGGYQTGQGINMNLGWGYSRVGGKGSITAAQVNQSLLNPLKVQVDPNIQAMHTQEKQQMKTLNIKFASFIYRVWRLEQQNKILETKWNLLQQQQTTCSTIHNMVESYINTL